MGTRNNPLAAQSPAPAFANDPSGFFGAVLAENRTAGIGSLLPAGTVTQSDVSAKGRLLAGQIAWTPAKARWKGCNLTVNLSDAQFMLALESGGDTQPGRITLLLGKSQLPKGTAYLEMFGTTFAVQAGGRWHEFTIVEMVGQHDDNDPGLTLFLEKDQDAIGE